MQHIIQYQLFDVVYANAGKAYDLQNKISDIFNNKLTAGMEQLFDRLVPENTVLTLSEISIDVGCITNNMLEHDLTERVLAELEREIRYWLILGQGVSKKVTSSEQVKSRKESYTDLLEYFLLTGTMPWWATGELMLDPLKVMEHLLKQDASGLRMLIVRVGQNAYVRQRIVQQFTNRVIRNIITLLEPAEAEFILNYHATAVKVQKEKKLVDSAPNDAFEKELWLFILTYLLVDRGSLFNQKMFVKSTLRQMAHHYNREYAELLSLLKIALNNQNVQFEQTGYLPLIIQELFANEADTRYPDKESPNNNINGEDVRSVQDIELIRHYLAFGSLPWWAVPYTESHIAELFLGLIIIAPKTLKAVIIAMGQSENVRKRMVTLFDDEVIISLVKLLEPVNAGFIIGYVTEVQQLHVKKVIAKTDSKDFKKAVWKFVLDFLLVQRGSEFNQRMFLQSNIKSLAANYSVQYSDMLSYFAQSISQLHQGSIEYAPLFKLLVILLNEERGTINNTGKLIIANVSTTLVPLESTQDRAVVLKDILFHWLQYGNIPWWGKEYFDLSPESMFATILATSPTDAVLIIKFAYIQANMQQRIINQLPVALITDIFRILPHGEEAVQLYQYVLEAMAALTKATQPEQTGLKKQLLLMLWNGFAANKYEKFDVAVFKYGVAHYLSVKHNVLPAITLKALKAKFNTVEGKAYTHILNEVSATEYFFDTELIALMDEGADVYTLINTYLGGNNMLSNKIADEAFGILSFYLVNNKLPGQFKGTNPAYVNAVVKQLLEFLTKANEARLKQVMEQSGRPELFKLIGTTQPTAQIDGGIEQMISAYLTESELPKTEVFINEALRILEYFLVNAKMPDYLSRVNVPSLIRQLLVLLNYERQAALTSLLQKDSHAVAARLQLHNVFASPANTAENNVATTLRSFFEQDALSYIRQTGGINVSSEAILTELLTPYLNQAQSHSHFILTLLKQAALSRYIAINYTDNVVYSLLDLQSNIIGGSTNVGWIKQVQQFFAANFTDTLLRDKFNNLLHEFNLMILGGHIAAKNPEEYIKALFRFISSENNSLFVELSKIVLNAGVNVATVVNLPLLIKAVRVQQQANGAVQEIKQSLKDADEQLLKHLPANKDEPKTKENKDSLPNNKDTLYINNAGIVLLNPFFATYFIRLGMMKEGKFIDTDTQHRAVHLLQYLVNGSEQSTEHTLVLNKILCNVPIAEPIPLGITITDNEKEVSAGLLKAVTERWEKMNNTSITGFQSSFLQRNGALLFKDDAWNLRVEQRGYDILLQTLPWTIGMIKAPWMDNFLYVEWT